MTQSPRRHFLKNSAIMGTGALLWFQLNPNSILAENRENSSLLFLPPFLGKPTTTSITVNLVAGDQPMSCYIDYIQSGKPTSSPFRSTPKINIFPYTPAILELNELRPSTHYDYKLWVKTDKDQRFSLEREGSFYSQRTDPSDFSFALFSDSHITPFKEDLYRVETLSSNCGAIAKRRPDFAMMLGDNIQTFTSHGGPMTEERFGPILYSRLRYAMGSLPTSVPIFNVVGNWEGENGWHGERERQWARQSRNAFIPGPDPQTYPEGGGNHGEYYGFRWGDALFLVLTVTQYTKTDHAMQSPVGAPDDWTLGEHQKTWLKTQLRKSKAKWKMLFIHHTVGGNAGDDVNSRYGRGGGRAADIGEQKQIHEWMKQYGVQALFYGHDHVFTDIAVDDIHYVCVGSAGAPWKFDEDITGYDQFWTPSGYTWVDVRASELKINFISPDHSGKTEQTLHTFRIPAN